MTTRPAADASTTGMREVSGNKIGGQAIAQALDPQNEIRKGKKYMLSVAVRFLATPTTLNYAKIRAIAFNGALPASGTTRSLAPMSPSLGAAGKSGTAALGRSLNSRYGSPTRIFKTSH
ncbi:MAG: hypothetical protein IPN33_22195 [Saprospiraceae bacterium]|nr:hypothetical protein [Saprospiraceae bacterium]